VLLQGSVVTVTVDKQVVFNQTLTQSTSSHGFVAVGTADFGLADFDNFVIDEVKNNVRA
jgi:hypothetical protein